MGGEQQVAVDRIHIQRCASLGQSLNIGAVFSFRMSENITHIKKMDKRKRRLEATDSVWQGVYEVLNLRVAIICPTG